MILNEILVQPGEYHNASNDNSSLSMSDVRHARITLMHLNQLRKIAEYRKAEKDFKLAEIVRQFRQR